MMGVAAGGTDLQEEDLPNELWAVYKKEREHREHVKEWIAATIGFAKNSIPYCHLSKSILDITPNKGISTAQAVYISTMAMTLDPNRGRAVELVNAFLEYSSDYRETLEFLLGKYKKEEKPSIPTTQIDRLRQDIVELVNGVKLDVAEHRANIDQLYEEVFNKQEEEEEEQQYCRCAEILENEFRETKKELQHSIDLIEMSVKIMKDTMKGDDTEIRRRISDLATTNTHKSLFLESRMTLLERTMAKLNEKVNYGTLTQETTPE